MAACLMHWTETSEYFFVKVFCLFPSSIYMRTSVLVLTAVLFRRHQSGSCTLLKKNKNKKKKINKACNQIKEDCKATVVYLVLKWTVTLWKLPVLVMYAKSSDQIKEKCLCRKWQMLSSWVHKAVYLLEIIRDY